VEKESSAYPEARILKHRPSISLCALASTSSSLSNLPTFGFLDHVSHSDLLVQLNFHVTVGSGLSFAPILFVFHSLLGLTQLHGMTLAL
jgi:hypothetical protein